jgi:hypothetical protein
MELLLLLQVVQKWVSKMGALKGRVGIFFKKIVIGVFFVQIFFLASFIQADQPEKFTITTYYPSPYGSYKELTTTGDTYLATGGSGNVGIGTTAPKALFQAGTSPAPGLFVKRSGNVGIGITSPQGYKLYVKGNMNVNGTLEVKENPGGTPLGGYSGILGLSRLQDQLWTPCDLNIVDGIIQSSGTTCCSGGSC